MINITLAKEKYRREPNKLVPYREWEAPTSERRGVPEGTRLYQAGRFKSKTCNAGSTQKKVQGNGPRRRQGWGSVTRSKEG